LITLIPDVPSIPDFVRDIQPILDAHCVSCHNARDLEGRISLESISGPLTSHSYSELNGLRQLRNSVNTGDDPPYTYFSADAPIMSMIDGSHYDVKLSARDRRMIILWLDAGGYNTGTYAALGTGMLADGTPGTNDQYLDFEVLERRCDACHLHRKRPANGGMNTFWSGEWPSAAEAEYNALVDLERPERSLLLRAPLAKAAGGLAWCEQTDATSKAGAAKYAGGAPPANVFTSTDDPDYKRLKAMVERAAAFFYQHQRWHMPGFRPNPWYLWSLQRSGVLPLDYDPIKDGFDPWKLDELYFQTQWHKPAEHQDVQATAVRH
jgi:hypothetical protein